MLTLQRTAFLQTLTHSGDGESGSGADDDDPPPLADVEEDDDDDDDDDYETIDGDSAESTAADQSTGKMSPNMASCDGFQRFLNVPISRLLFWSHRH